MKNQSLKRLAMSLLLSCVILTGCESGGWFGEDSDTPLEGERIPLFNYDQELRRQDGSAAATSEVYDVKTTIRDDIPIRDVTAAEAAAIAATETALREMEQDLKDDPLAPIKQSENQKQMTQSAAAQAAPENAAKKVDFVADTSATAETAAVNMAQAMSEDDAATAALAAQALQARKEQKVVRTAQATEAAAINVADASVIGGFIQPPIWENEFWPQAGGYSSHAMQHLAFNQGEPKKLWSTSIGSGSTKQLPLTAQPVVVDEKVFTVDTKGVVRAFDVNGGKELWSREIIKETEKDPVIGGGLAFSSGQLYATNGFNEVLALDPYDGRIVWRTGLTGPARAAPAAVPGKVFVTTLDNRLIALDSSDGKILWDHQGLTASAGLLGSASPASNRDIVVPAYSSGEVYALRIDNGAAAWADNLTPARRTDSITGLTDIRALPVIDKGVVLAMSYADKLAAIDERTGARIWEQPIGGTQTPWVAGNRIFVIDKNMKLYALNRANGAVVWMTELPAFKKPKDNKGPIEWYGPIFAGERLLAFSSEGMAYSFDPVTGQQKSSWKTGGDVVQGPVIAGGRLYLLTTSGTLSAWE